MDNVGLVLKFKCGKRDCEKSVTVSIDLSKISIVNGKITPDYFEAENALRDFGWKYDYDTIPSFENCFSLCPEHK